MHTAAASHIPRAAIVAAVAWLGLAASAAGAVRPADGAWQANGMLGPWSEVVYFTVAGNGTQVTETNGLIGNPISCGWAGRWAEPPTVPIAGGAFTAHQAGAAAVDPDQLNVTGTFTTRSSATLTFTLSCLRSEGLITQTRTFAATTDAPPPAHCASARVTGGTLELGGSGAARAHPNRFRHAAAVRITHRHADCAAVEQVMDSVLRARDESAALASAGYVISRISPVRRDGHRGYRISARQPAGVGASLGYVRDGAPRIDHSIFRAGQWIDVYGRTVHEECTASWVLQPRAGGAPVGVTAGHCMPRDLIEDAPVLRAIGGAEPTRLGTILGASPGGLDAATFSLDPDVGVAQQVERGDRLPLTAVGWVPTADQHKGDRVCFAGRRTGADRCGRIVDRYSLVSKSQTCTDIEDHQGDSGGPVYTATAGATTRAVGIVAVAVAHGLRRHRRMCYVPIEPILNAFGADFAAGPLVRGPGTPQ